MEVVTSKKKANMKGLMQYRDYSILLMANIISRFGDAIDSIAYGWMVYKLTGSNLLMGTLFAINALPNVIFGPFAGVIADRYDKKKLIIIGYTGRGIIVSLTAMLFFIGLLEPWHLFIFTIINSTLETITAPVFTSITPLIIPRELYLTANSFSTSAYKFAELVGMGAAGVIIGLLGISGALIIDGVTFFIAAFLIMLMKIKHESTVEGKINAKEYVNDLKEAFNFVKKSYLIRTALILFAIVNFCLAPINVLMPAFVNDVLKSGVEMLSFLGIALSVGMIIGGVLVGQFGNRFKNHISISFGLVFFGLSYSILFIPGNIIPWGIYSNIIAIAAFFLLGFVIPIMSAPITTNIMLNTDKDMIGRVSSFMAMMSYCAIPLGSSITGAVSEIMPMAIIFAIMGGIIILVGLRMMLNKKFKEAA